MRQMMTKETREKLRKSSTDGLEELREKINNIIKLRKNNEQLNTLLNFDLFVTMAICDTFVLIKQYTVTDQRWEEIRIAGQIYTKMNEGIKKIIGFGKGRSNSYWIKVMGYYIDNSPELKSEYVTIKDKLIKYANNNDIQEYIKSIRDYDVHGDENLDSFNLLNKLNAINIDKSFKLLVDWGTLLKDIASFTSCCIQNEIIKK